jgi:hypothetical protein
MTATEVARGILDRGVNDRKISYVVADPSM